MTIFEKHCPDDERAPVWGVISEPKRDHHHAMRALVDAAWIVYEPHAERTFLRGLQGKAFSQRWWEMYLWNRLDEMGLEVSHAGDGMPDASVRWRNRTVYFECISPTVGKGDNEIPEFPGGTAHQVPSDPVTLRLTSAVYDKMRQAENRRERLGNSHYVIAVDTSQLQFSGFDEQFHLRALFPLGNQVVTFSRDDFEIVGTHYEYRPEIEREGRESILTSAFLNNTDYKIVSTVLYCNANVGNIARVANPGFTLVHNFHAEKSLSRKLFRNELQYMWDGYDSIFSRKPRNTDDR